MSDVYASVYIMKETTDIRGITMVHTFVVEAPEHTEVSGYRIQGLSPVREPLLVGFEVLSVDVPEGYRGPSEEERIGMKGILIQAGRSVAAVLL